MKFNNYHNFVAFTNVMVLTTVFFLCTLTVPRFSHAEEGGCGHYIPGLMASFVDSLPGKEGLAVANYFVFYSGSASASRTIPVAGLATAQLNATLYADMVLAMYKSPLKLLGGNYSAAVGVPYVWSEANGRATLISDQGTFSFQSRDTTSNIGDIAVYPVMLGWRALDGDLRYDMRFGVFMPTGDYKLGHLANPGKNFWTFEPGIYVSYISSKIGTEVSLFAAFDFNTNNGDTGYQSGDSFHIDYTVAQHLPLLGGLAGAGVTGFYYKQFTADSGSGAQLGSFEGKTVGVGPVMSYAHKVGGRDLVGEVKWLSEVDVKYRLEGDYIWFKLGMMF